MIDQSEIIKAGLSSLARIDFNLKILERHRPENMLGDAGVFVSNSEIPSAITAICDAQSTAYLCLFDNGTRHAESGRMRNLRLDRVNRFREKCGNPDVSELRKRSVRNGLAHFDEKYLKALCDHPNGIWVQDAAISHLSAMEGLSIERMIRVLVYDQNKIYLFGASLDILSLRDDLLRICDGLGMKFINNP